MVGAEESNSMMDWCPTENPTADGEDSPGESFQCCICMDLLFKPVVLVCGHISCFWCVHRAMHQLQTSHCAMCRQPYKHFPTICLLLHNLLVKMAPMTSKRREQEVLEEEHRLDVFSPQSLEKLISNRNHSGEINSGTLKEIEKTPEDLKNSLTVASEESISPQSVLEKGISKLVSTDDVLCALCKELLFQPKVLNCGHVYCEPCLSGLVDKPIKCQVCQTLHPGNFPNVCLDLDHFLEEQFPREYATRREKLQSQKPDCQNEEKSSSSSSLEEKTGKSSSQVKRSDLALDDDYQNAHVGVGCDSCGLYPIIGKRYRCIDCKEAIGFDLCDDCYNTSSKLPGRFNQQHTPDHRFELDDSHLLSNILEIRYLSPNDIASFVLYTPNDGSEDHDDSNSSLETSDR